MSEPREVEDTTCPTCGGPVVTMGEGLTHWYRPLPGEQQRTARVDLADELDDLADRLPFGSPTISRAALDEDRRNLRKAASALRSTPEAGTMTFTCEVCGNTMHKRPIAPEAGTAEARVDPHHEPDCPCNYSDEPCACLAAREPAPDPAPEPPRCEARFFPDRGVGDARCALPEGHEGPHEVTFDPAPELRVGTGRMSEQTRADLIERLENAVALVDAQRELAAPLAMEHLYSLHLVLEDALDALRSTPEAEGRVHNGKVEGDDWPALVCAVRSKRHGIELTVPSESAQRLWRLGYEVREYVPRELSGEGETARVDALEEFYAAWQAIEEGVVGFDLHGEAVERFRRAHEAVEGQRIYKEKP